jgi:HEAT repeat protein
MGLYRNNLKNLDFGREAPFRSDPEQATLPKEQGARGDQSGEKKRTLPEINLCRRVVLIPLCTALLAPMLAFASPSETKLQALFLMQQNRVEESIERYRQYTQMTGRNDFEMLQQMGLTLLQKGIASPDHQTFLITLFGAGLSGSNYALEILEKGIHHPDPQTQLLALHFISKIEDDRTDEILNLAMSSDFLSTRMEAAYYLSLRKHPHAVGQIEGLMFRLPPAYKPFFPSLFALIGTHDATQTLRRLIEDPDLNVRIESILQVARTGRDDFLPMLRKRLSHSHIAELEAVLFALSALKDSAALPKIKRHAFSSVDNVRLAAALALFNLGDRSAVGIIEELASKKNLFAIAALGAIPGSEERLAEFMESSDLQIRINAAMSLLQLRDPRCLPGLMEILFLDARNLAFQPIASVGRSQTALRAVPSAELRAKDPSIDLSYSVAIREHLLREAMHLSEDDFLQVVRLLFRRQQNDLVPTAIALLENLQTEKAKRVLQEGADRQNAPLIRDYCHLALYRLKEEGPYEDHVIHWVMQQKEAELIRLRPMLPWKFRMEQEDYSLSPEETSKLLIDSFLSIASRRDERSIGFLLEAIQHGNPLNRFALMGLLMKATE